MKICPNCRSSADDSQNFCLQCGTPLTASNIQGFSDENATVVRPSNMPTQQIPSNTWQNQGATNPHQFGAPTFNSSPIPPQPIKKRSIVPIILLTFFGTVALLAFGGVIVWFATRPRTVSVPNNNKNGSVTVVTSPTPKPSPSASSWTSPSPTPTASPSATLSSDDVDEIKDNVNDTLDSWKDSSENYDIEDQISCYAETLDTYYKQKNVSVSRVRADREKAYSVYADKIKIDLSNNKITPDPSGEKATVILDKTWDFQGEKFSSGSVQQQLILQKFGDKWKITSEQDLKVYYVDKGTNDDDQ